mgnify:CR=1 FL=1
MRFWLIAEPIGKSSEPVWKVYSDNAILAEYWDYWRRKMTDYNTIHNIPEGTAVTHTNCIDDWTVVNWAVPATPEALLNILSAPNPN